MRISDLFENKKEEYDEHLKREVMDVLVLYNVTGTNRTNIINIISELEKEGIHIDQNSLSEIICDIGFEIDGETIIFDDTSGDGDDLLDDEEFDPVSAMAKKATDDRLK